MAAERVASKTNAEARRRARSRSKSDFMGSMTSWVDQPTGWVVECINYQYSQWRANPSGWVRCACVRKDAGCGQDAWPALERPGHSGRRTDPKKGNRSSGIDVNARKESRGAHQPCALRCGRRQNGLAKRQPPQRVQIVLATEFSCCPRRPAGRLQRSPAQPSRGLPERLRSRGCGRPG